jgi:hypothetical protein
MGLDVRNDNDYHDNNNANNNVAIKSFGPHGLAWRLLHRLFLLWVCRVAKSDYRLDDQAIEVRSPAEKRDFSSILCVQTGSGAHPASCTMGTWGPLPGGKAQPWRDADHSPPSSSEVVNE